jgi:hypothetical protein
MNINMKKIILFSLGVTILTFLFSCKKEFDDLNVSPNSPTDAPSQMLIANVIVSTAYDMQLSAGLVITDQWVQHTKATTYYDEDHYNPRSDRMDVIWRHLYSRSFEDCIQAINMAVKNSQPDNHAIALIMKAYIGYNLTMLYGDVPYTQAGNGDNGTILPAYDTQLAVLNGIIADLDQAISLIGTTTTSVEVEELGTYDYLYAGDMTKWKKFANGLKLRVYLTMNAGGLNKTSEINAILGSSDIFQSSADEAKLIYSTSANPVYQWVNPGSSRADDFRMSQTLVNYMMGSSADSTLPADKRLTVYADPVASGPDSAKYHGGRNGIHGGAEIVNNSHLGSLFYNLTTPFYFMSYSELLFIKAETNPNQQNYTDAVTASFLQNGLTTQDATDMLSDTTFMWDNAKGAQLIGEQKWVSLFGQGVEAFNSWRRTGFPHLTPAANAATVNGFVPRRIAYNTDEINLNVANIKTAIQGLTPAIDRISSQVWFDKLHANNFGNN